jgi:parvulin-like peptidyl-prolyl isomerase
MKNRFLTILFFLLLCLPLRAQKTAPPLSVDTLALVGSSVITERDLIERIELMPWEGKEKPKQYDSSKIKALSSLVAERLLAIEGKHLNVGSDDVSQLKVRGMEKMFVRDELFKREVKQKVAVSEIEIREGLAKFAWQLHVAAIDVKDQSAGDSVYRMLKKNISLSKILSTIGPDCITAVETVQVNFGGLDTLFENAVYAIGRKNYSKPFLSQTYGWTVAVLIDRGTNPVYEKMNWADRRTRVDELIRKKRENITAGRYYVKILAPQKAKTDSALFFMLAKELYAILFKDSVRHRSKGLFAIMAEDIDLLLTTFRSDLQRPFVELSERPLMFGEAIESLRNLRLGFPSLEENSFYRALNSHLRTVVETELVAREGYRQNLQYSENVKRDLQTWSNYWSSRYLMWQVDDSVSISNEELLSPLLSSMQAIGSAYEVNIQEVLCDSIAASIRVLDEYSRGSSLSELAKRYSRRTEWKDRGGVSQFIPLNRYSEITCRAFLADTGAVIGPVKTNDGYSVFKVLGKRSLGGSFMPTADSVTINIRNNLLSKKRSRSMSTYVANLAKNYSVDVRYEKLPGVKIQPANMFTHRIIGFGGVITATPILYPNWEWMKEYRDEEKKLP